MTEKVVVVLLRGGSAVVMKSTQKCPMTYGLVVSGTQSASKRNTDCSG